MEQDPTDPTGVRETSSSVQKATLVARQRKAAMAADLYVERHKTYEQIAKKCGYPDARAARVAVENFLAEELREHPRSIGAMRDMAGRRLDNLLRQTAKKALNPKDPEHLAAAQQYRGIIGDWAKLYGLHAPQQVVVSNPTSDAIVELAMQISMQGVPQLEQGDIFADDADDSEILELQRKQEEARAQREADAERRAAEEDIVDAELVPNRE